MYKYRSIKFKLPTIINDPNLFNIIGRYVTKENKIITEGMNLLNNYVYYCHDHTFRSRLDTTIIRQSCMLIINPLAHIGIIKKNFKEPDLTDKSDDEIIKILEKHEEHKKNCAIIGQENVERTQILEDAYNNYFLDSYSRFDIEIFQEEPGLTLPIEIFSQTFMANIENHLVHKYFQFQLRYLTLIIKDKLSKFDLTNKQTCMITTYIQKCINIDEKIDFICNDIFSDDLYLNIKKNVDEIIKEQSECLKIKRATYNDLLLTKENDQFYKKHYEKILKESLDEIIEYYFVMSKYLTDKKVKSFSILPQLSLGYQHIVFDERSLATIYSKWKKIDLSVAKFKANFLDYFNQMFNIKRKCKRCYKQGYTPKNISTDGYSVTVLFVYKDKIKKTKKTRNASKKTDDQPEKINLETLNNGMPLMSGIYDADNIECSIEYIEQYQLKAIDTGNKRLASQMSEAYKSTIITNAYYNEISHNNLNYKKKMKMMKAAGMDDINKELAKTTRITTDHIEYNKYVNITRKFNNRIWSFYNQTKLKHLKYDSYVKKREAICKIARELVPRIRKEKVKKRKRKKKSKDKRRQHRKGAYFDKEVHDRIKNLPTMIAFGKGNGSLTIENTKGSSAHGPIKKLIEYLMRICLVILVDEFMSSQLCCMCHTKLVHSKVIEDISKKKQDTELKKKQMDDTYITRMDRIKKGRELKKELDSEREKENPSDQKIEKLQKELKEQNVFYECYRLCSCKNCHKLWHRDINAPINIGGIMVRKLTGQPLGAFSRKT